MVISSASGAVAQERTFTVTLPEAQWNAVAKIVSKAKEYPWEETNPILSAIGGQISQQLQQQAQAARESANLQAEVKRLQDELKRVVDAQKPPDDPAPPENPK